MAANYRRSKFQSPSYGPTSSAFASSSISSRSSNLLHRSTSPTPASVSNSAASIRFSLDRRASSPNRSVSVSANQKPVSLSETKRTCMCSPTNHPGSFRCSLHKKNNNNCRTTSYGSNKLVKSAMANSLVRIGAVEGDLVKRALAALIRPSSHQLRRRQNFQRLPSRFSVMSRE